MNGAYYKIIFRVDANTLALTSESALENMIDLHHSIMFLTLFLIVGTL